MYQNAVPRRTSSTRCCTFGKRSHPHTAPTPTRNHCNQRNPLPPLPAMDTLRVVLLPCGVTTMAVAMNNGVVPNNVIVCVGAMSPLPSRDPHTRHHRNFISGTQLKQGEISHEPTSWQRYSERPRDQWVAWAAPIF